MNKKKQHIVPKEKDWTVKIEGNQKAIAIETFCNDLNPTIDKKH